MAKRQKKKVADKACVERRIDELLRIKLDGAEFSDVREYVRQKEIEAGSNWFLEDGHKPYSDKMLRNYITRVHKIMFSGLPNVRSKIITEHRAKVRNLYARAVTTGDLSTALRALHEEGLILGLYITKIETTNKTELSEMSDADLDAERGRLRKEIARHEARLASHRRRGSRKTRSKT